MPSIAGFIQSLLAEDMYATGMIEEMDQRISELGNGQLRLLVCYCDDKVPGLTNKTVLDAYTKLLRKAIVETDKRAEEEVRGERERLRKLKAAHAGANAKAWDTSHANLDKELVKFQKFLKSKARRVGEEEVLQEEMEKLHSQILALPARRVAADNRRHLWWAIGATLVIVVAPILVLSLLPVALWAAIGSLLVSCLFAFACWFIGVLSGSVVAPTLNDDEIEDKTRTRAKEKLKDYRAEVRRNYEATEKTFDADMKWREDWAESRKKERRDERRKAASTGHQETGRANSGRVAPGGGDPDPAVGEGGPEGNARTPSAASKALGHQPTRAAGANVGALDGSNAVETPDGDSDGKLPDAQIVWPGGGLGVTRGQAEENNLRQGQTRGPCQGSCLLENPTEGSGNPNSVGVGQAGGATLVGAGVHAREQTEGSRVTFVGEEKGEAVA